MKAFDTDILTELLAGNPAYAERIEFGHNQIGNGEVKARKGHAYPVQFDTHRRLPKRAHQGLPFADRLDEKLLTKIAIESGAVAVIQRLEEADYFVPLDKRPFPFMPLAASKRGSSRWKAVTSL